MNAANAELLGCFRPPHACIDHAIHAAAGPWLREDCWRSMARQMHHASRDGAGRPVFINVRGSADFMFAPYAEQAARLDAWMRERVAAPLLVLEIGAGVNTPGVIRWLLENHVYVHVRIALRALCGHLVGSFPRRRRNGLELMRGSRATTV